METTASVFGAHGGVTLVPCVHGSADWALALRRLWFQGNFEALAVPLPPSFQSRVEKSLEQLPRAGCVIQRETSLFGDDDSSRISYVPIDPCQGVIAVLRLALQERVPRYFVDCETAHFEPLHRAVPDAYALGKVTLDEFCASLVSTLPNSVEGQAEERVAAMADGMGRLARKNLRVLALCDLDHWLPLRRALREGAGSWGNDPVEPAIAVAPDPSTLVFMFGELPFITSLHEQARVDLDTDENLSVDGVKELFIAARDSYKEDLGRRARNITPQNLSQTLKYVRNLSLLDCRLTPDLYTLVMGAAQCIGDTYARHVAQTARDWCWGTIPQLSPVTFGVGTIRTADGEIHEAVSRLPGAPMEWRSVDLKPLPNQELRERWEMQWDPRRQCSWPPEDDAIESFRSAVFGKARELLGQDLARSEKFSTSVMDGLDIRETLRNWHTGDIYVKVLPPSRSGLDAAVMLFDTPSDPRDYPWRATWYAEHDEESTLAFYATQFGEEIVGPGIGLATYGGAMFLYPPRPIPDIWTDQSLDFCLTLEERIVAAACCHGSEGHVAYLAAQPPTPQFRELARRWRKKLVHVPLGQFGSSTIEQLRLVHVLNGHEIRSFASHFIRRA